MTIIGHDATDKEADGQAVSLLRVWVGWNPVWWVLNEVGLSSGLSEPNELPAIYLIQCT